MHGSTRQRPVLSAQCQPSPRCSAAGLAAFGPVLQRSPFASSSGSSVSASANSQVALSSEALRGHDSLQQPARAPKKPWWHTDAPNVEITDDMKEVELILSTNAVHKPKPCVVHFFASDCHGCKSMHPKANQIMEQNPDIHFVKVNASAQDMKYFLASRWNITKLPYFISYTKDIPVSEFTCNLSTVDRFRRALEQLRNVHSWTPDPEEERAADAKADGETATHAQDGSEPDATSQAEGGQ